ncbi:cellulose synthase [Devosia sp. FKR38]|uniref:cellulose synthase n=1 Tax=Devosia sp. FKR38 TaxID=2562312 RepID=UPI0010BF6C1B|nr:cellulose synthase [Devosia sp. FKR38]
MTHGSHRLMLGLLAGLVLTTGAAAQQSPVTSMPRPAPQSGPAVDESALRYFARQGDERRLRAETARLAAIYPGWVPPADPLAEVSTVDESLQAMWDLFGAGDLAGVDAAIAARQASDPNWHAPKDLVDALAASTAAADIRAAAIAREHARVIALAANHPDILVCTNVDLLWSLAEAFAAAGSDNRAVEAYQFVLNHCDPSPERLATMQKARLVLSADDLEVLYLLERDGEFASVRVDQARQMLADVVGGALRQADPAAVSLMQQTVAAEPSAGDLRLLGYYELKNNRGRQARMLFQKAFDIDSAPESITGLALSMMQTRDLVDAESLLADHRYGSDELDGLYLTVANAVLLAMPPIELEPDTLVRITDSINEAKDYAGAQAVGWYALNYQQSQTAARWFQKALEYNPGYEPAAYGLLVASDKLKDRETVKEIMRKWGALSPRIALFGTPGAPTEAPVISSIPEPSLYAPAVYRLGSAPAFLLVAQQTAAQKRAYAQCGTYRDPATLSPAQALPRAWCLMDLERSSEAEAAFRRAILTTSVTARTDGYYGLTLALLRVGLVEEAAIAAAAMPQSAERVREMQLAILSSTAVAYFNIGRYDEVLQLLDHRAHMAPEQNDLLTIRAWSYYHLGRLRDARHIFAAVAATGYADAQRGLEAVEAHSFQ